MKGVRLYNYIMFYNNYSNFTRLLKSNPSANCSPGLTLIEVVIALFVLGVVLTSSITMMGQGFLSVDHSRNLNRASQILQTEMETLRSYSWAEIDALAAESDFVPFNGAITFNMNNIVCKRILSTEKMNQKRIRLVVSWSDVSGAQRERFYEAYYTKEGISDYYSRAL